MFVLLLTLCFFAVEGLPFLPLSSLKDCPNVPAQDDVKISQIVGSWRLAYLFYDNDEIFEEDGTCVLTEIAQVNEAQLGIDVHMDFHEDAFTIDRSSFELVASLHNPGEWLLHSNLSSHAYIHVTVISLSRSHMILTFCISNSTDRVNREYDPAGEYPNNYLLERLRSDDKTGVKKGVKRFNSGDDANVDKELSDLFSPKTYFRRRRSLRGFKRGSGDNAAAIAFFNEFMKNVKIARDRSQLKHFWTIVLVKDNNVSALNFLEKASLLIKFGFDIKQGNLVSFGACGTK